MDGDKGVQGCQVGGCNFDLAEAGKYHRRKRICPRHMQASVVYLATQNSARDGHRFCQQCGRLHPLRAFQGAKKSCEESLKKRQEYMKALKAAARSILQAQRGMNPAATDDSDATLSCETTSSSSSSGESAAPKRRKRSYVRKEARQRHGSHPSKKRRCQPAATAAAVAAVEEEADADDLLFAAKGSQLGDLPDVAEAAAQPTFYGRCSRRSSNHNAPTMSRNTITPIGHPQQLLQTAASSQQHGLDFSGAHAGCQVMTPVVAADAGFVSQASLGPPGVSPVAVPAAAVMAPAQAVISPQLQQLPTVGMMSTAAVSMNTTCHISLPPTTFQLPDLSSAPLPAWLSGPDQIETTSPGQIPGCGQSAGGGQQQQQQQQQQKRPVPQSLAAGHTHTVADFAAPPTAIYSFAPAVCGATLITPRRKACRQSGDQGSTGLMSHAEGTIHPSGFEQTPGLAAFNSEAARAAATAAAAGGVVGSYPTLSRDDIKHIMHCSVPGCDRCITGIVSQLFVNMEPDEQLAAATAAAAAAAVPAGHRLPAAAAAATVAPQIVQQQHSPVTSAESLTDLGAAWSGQPGYNPAGTNTLANATPVAAAAAAVGTAAPDDGWQAATASAMTARPSAADLAGNMQQSATAAGGTSAVQATDIAGLPASARRDPAGLQQQVQSLNQMLWVLGQFKACVDEFKSLVGKSNK